MLIFSLLDLFLFVGDFLWIRSHGIQHHFSPPSGRNILVIFSNHRRVANLSPPNIRLRHERGSLVGRLGKPKNLLKIVSWGTWEYAPKEPLLRKLFQPIDFQGPNSLLALGTVHSQVELLQSTKCCSWNQCIHWEVGPEDTPKDVASSLFQSNSLL